MKKYLLALLVLVVVLVGQIKGISGLYMRMPWLDIPMHILGGLGIALFISALTQYNGMSARSRMLTILFGTLAIGIVWEIFEISFDMTVYPAWTILYYMDTVKDLFDDMLGAGIAVWLFNRNK